MEPLEYLLILDDHNTENGEMPELTDETKKRIKVVRILENSNLNWIPSKAFRHWSSLESVHIEDGTKITTIGWNAFRDCSSLKSVNIPIGVTIIGGYAFYGCVSLKSMNIPNSVTTIGRAAFAHCSSLQSIHIPSTVTPYIARNIFDGCHKLDQRQTNGTNYHPDTATWLRQRFDNLPIHHTCYYANDDTQSAIDLLSTLIQENRHALAATDAMGMTPLDILCCNSRATIDMIGVLVQNDPSLEQTGLSPFMLAAVLPACELDVVFAMAMSDLSSIV